jgi:hypothetical protein
MLGQKKYTTEYLGIVAILNIVIRMRDDADMRRVKTLRL